MAKYNFKDLTGQNFGYLIVIKRVGSIKQWLQAESEG